MILALAGITLLVFIPVRRFEFVSLDDAYFIVGNPYLKDGLSWPGIRWAFSASLFSNSPYADHWQPLVFLFQMAVTQFFGLHPSPFHLVNLVFHLFNTVLLFLILRKMTEKFWESGLVAALFALHPLHVESVAWVSELKDVLSAFLGFLALGAYAAYSKRPSWLRYLLVIFFFVLGLMAKPMLVTLPFVFLLLDHWPLHRLNAKAWREKIPFFIVSAFSAWITAAAQFREGGGYTLEILPLKIRLMNVLAAYTDYLGKMFWPENLAVFYPYYGFSISYLQAAGAFLLLLGITLGVLWRRGKTPYLFTGWFWYLITLVPVIGFVQAGQQSLADRYTYLPLIGPFIMMVWGVSELSQNKPYRKGLLTVIGTLTILGLGFRTSKQLQTWQNNVSLFEHAAQSTRNNYLAYKHLCTEWLERGDLARASASCEEALKIKPDYPEANNAFGVILQKQGKISEAIPFYEHAIRVKPGYAEPRNNLGLALAALGRPEEAGREFQKALELRPEDDGGR